MFVRQSFRLLLALTTVAILTGITTPGFGRSRGGGRAGGGRGASARSGARNVSPPGGRQLSGAQNLGGKLNQAGAGAAQNFAGAQQLQGAMQQFQGGAAGRLPAQATDRNWQQQAGQMQQQAQSRLSQRSGEWQQNAQSWASNFQNGPQPFSPSWYAQHPQAWQYTHPHADAVAVATAASVTAWVGSAYYAGTSGSAGGSETTVVYEQAPVEQDPALQETPQQVTPGVAANVVATDPSTGAWLELGTYALATTPGVPPTVMLQLAVDHQGAVRGVYYDSLTNTTHNVVGNLDGRTQVVHWTLESNNQLAFQAPVAGLLEPSSSVQVTLPSGPQQWQLTRVELDAQQ